MSTGRPPPGSIPTLTEVVPWPGGGNASPVQPPGAMPAPSAPATSPAPAAATGTPTPPATPPAAPAPAASLAPAAPTPAPTPANAPGLAAKPSPSEVQLTQRVLADLQRQVELMLEVRLREALAPILARATDAIVRDARKELTTAMRDIVSKSIARELGRREDR